MTECTTPPWRVFAEKAGAAAWAHKKKLAAAAIILVLILTGKTPAEAIRIAFEILAALAGL